MPTVKRWDGTSWVPVSGPAGPQGIQGIQGVQGAAGTGSWTVTSQTTTYTAVSGNMVIANGTFTVTLPAATLGAQIGIKNTGTGTVTVSRAGSALIDGATTFVLDTQYAAITVVSDGTNWFVI